MEDIQTIFNRIQENKKKKKDIAGSYKDALELSEEYKEIGDKIKALRARKQQIEADTKLQFSGEFNKLDEIKIDMESDNVLLSDAALTKYTKGETVELVDEYNNKYEPQFSVKFKKVY